METSRSSLERRRSCLGTLFDRSCLFRSEAIDVACLRGGLPGIVAAWVSMIILRKPYNLRESKGDSIMESILGLLLNSGTLIFLLLAKVGLWYTVCDLINVGTLFSLNEEGDLSGCCGGDRKIMGLSLISNDFFDLGQRLYFVNVVNLLMVLLPAPLSGLVGTDCAPAPY
jgi:hypothetical protein